MPLEAVLVVLDNSEYALNGDYGTTRWDSQLDSVKVLYNAKMNSNPENVLGVMTMAGKSPEVLASPTQNFGAIISAISDVKLQGEADLMTGINVAQLALKHRQNKNQRQRVIVFVGSPLERTSSAELVKLGKKMKKNNVAVDIVNFGEDSENEEKLREFVEAVNSSDNSHLVSVPAGTVLLSDMILSSAMLAEDGVVPPGGAGGSGGGGGSGEAGGAGGDDFGAVDPNLDPELAMALRMSLEEERARQSRNQETQPAAAAAASSTLPTVQEGALAGESLATTTSGPSAETVATSLPPDLASNAAAGPPQAASSLNAKSSGAEAVGPTSSLPEVKKEETAEEDSSMDADEDADLALALALSKGEGDGEGDVDMDANQATAPGDEDEEMDEDEAIARAIAMSMKEEEEGQGGQQ